MNKQTRREINKKIMFNKIMPTHLIDPNIEEDNRRTETVQKMIQPKQDVPEEVAAKAPEIQPDADAKPKQSTKKKEETEQTPPVAAKPASNEPHLVNLTECLAKERVDAMLDKFKCCHCDICKNEVLLHVLNHLPPNYIYQTPAQIKKAIAQADTSQLVTCFIQAIIQNRTNPKHPIEESVK